MQPQPDPTPSPGPPIDFGWLLDAELTASQREAVRAAREAVAKQLEAWFPAFTWRLPLVVRTATEPAGIDEPATRLHEGVQERDTNGWDFALVVTPRDLRSYYKSYALAVPSRALAVAVLSIARLVPADEEPPRQLSERIAALALHLFGDLNGLWHRDEADAVMRPPEAVGDLDRERDLSSRERQALASALEDVADLRLEETPRPPHPASFYLRASWDRAGEIAGAVLQARPWELPFRLSRLSAAAFSALFLLLVTAEVWDLGMVQRPSTIAILSLLVLTGTTVFILARQKLILRRARGRLSEQAVVMNVSATLVVLLGMGATYGLLFGLALGLGLLLFGPELVGRWAPAIGDPGALEPRLVMAGLISSLGLLIGSLGASFEGPRYFRHVIYADEET